MRIFVLIILLICPWVYSFSTDKPGSSKNKSHSINIEVGHSTSMFINTDIDAFTGNVFAGHVKFYEPTFYKLNFQYTKHLTVSFDYKSYYYMTWPYDINRQGYVWLLGYHAFDLSAGYLMTSKNKIFRLEPYISLSARPSGTENVFVARGGAFTETRDHLYDYNSLGFGLGLNGQAVLWKHLTLGCEIQYNYYFEKNKLRSRLDTEFEEFGKNYKVNRQMLTPIFKLGYLFNF
ncbi:MAG: hypothetical protein ACKVQB_06815 [Bacteroidia bacterium]